MVVFRSSGTDSAFAGVGVGFMCLGTSSVTDGNILICLLMLIPHYFCDIICPGTSSMPSADTSWPFGKGVLPGCLESSFERNSNLDILKLFKLFTCAAPSSFNRLFWLPP